MNDPIEIVVNDKMQTDYRYILIQKTGAQFDPVFTPYYSPQQMLEMGAFEGVTSTIAPMNSQQNGLKMPRSAQSPIRP